MRILRRRLRFLGLLLMVATGGSGTAFAADVLPTATPGMAAETSGHLILEVTFNTVQQGPAFVFRRAGSVLVRVPDLERWRLKRIPLKPETIDGESYLPLEAFPGLVYRVDDQTQTIEITAPAPLLEAVQIDAGAYSYTDLSEAAFGTFINYNVIGQHVGDRTTVAGFFEAAVSDDWGLFLNTVSAGNSIGREDIVRFDSTYIWDNPARVMRVSVGDALSDGGIVGRSLRFAGIGAGTEFGLQPELTTFPTPFFNGEAALPSTVQIYVNDILNYTRNIDRGPFSINRIPVLTGSGNMKLVMKDALGVERVYNVPYYAGSANLRQGLETYYVGGGFLRESYGLRSFDYGPAFATGTYRRGLSDSLTFEVHAEGERAVQMASGDVSWLVPNVGELGLTVAGSTGRAGDGALGGVSFQRDDIYWNIFGSYQRATRKFRQVGLDFAGDFVKTQAQAGIGLALGFLGNVSATYGKVDYMSGLNTDVLTVTHGVQIGSRAHLTTFGLISRASGAKTATTIGIGLTIPFGYRAAAAVRVDHQAGGTIGTAEYRVTPPTDEGLGYGVTGSTGRFTYGTADVMWRNRYNALRAEVDYRQGRMAGLVEANGSFGLVDGHAFAAREIDDSYGIVVLPGHEDVVVMQENRPVTRTNSDGVAILPSLNSYQENRISVDADKLPISSRLSAGSITVIPRYRSATVTQYPISNLRSGSVTVLRPDGTPVAAGARVQIEGTKGTTFAGFRGEVFIEDLRDNLMLRVDDDGGLCVARLGDIPEDATLPQLPPITCAQ